MKNFKIALVLSALTGILVIPSCIDSCDSGEYLPFFDVKDMHVTPFKSIPSREVITSEDSLEFSAFGGIEVSFVVDYVAEKAPSLQIPFSNPFVSSAFACSPIPDGLDGSKEEALVDFYVLTLNDFDEDHLAGSKLNDLFQVSDPFSYDSDFPSIDEYVQGQTGNLRGENLILGLIKEPEINPSLKLRIGVAFSNGETYEQVIDVKIIM